MKPERHGSTEIQAEATPGLHKQRQVQQKDDP
jgi:hypothetical protein